MFKRISLYLKYLKEVKKYKNNFLNKGFQLGYWGKIGKKITVNLDQIHKDEELSVDAYLSSPLDVDKLAEGYINTEVKNLNDILKSLNLFEMVESYSLTKTGKYDYILEFGYKFINTDKLFKKIIRILFGISVAGIGFLIYKLFSFNMSLLTGLFSPQIWIIIIIGLLIIISNFFRNKNIQK